MQSLAFASIKSLRESLEKKQITAAELLQYSLNRFKTYDQKVGSALEVFDAESITNGSRRPSVFAKATSDRSASSPCTGTKVGTGLLAGIPGLIKDNIAQNGRAL